MVYLVADVSDDGGKGGLIGHWDDFVGLLYLRSEDDLEGDFVAFAHSTIKLIRALIWQIIKEKHPLLFRIIYWMCSGNYYIGE